METLIDELAGQRQLAIVERFEGFINYVYPIALNIRRTHHIVRDRFIDAVFEQVNVFNQVGKSNRIWPTYKLLRRNSVLSAKRKIARCRETGDCLALSRFAASWRGHAKWANSFNLVNQLGIAP